LSRVSLLIVPILALAGLSTIAGEDRTETIADSRGSKELIYRNDALAEERVYDNKGAILEERTFDLSSLPAETRTYIRENGRIVKVEAKDASGSPSGSMTYRYDRDGRLLGLSSEGSLGTGFAGMIAARGVPQGEWVAGKVAGIRTTVLGYDGKGRAAFVQTIQDGKVLSIEKRSYGEDGSLAAVRNDDTVSGLSSETVYDSKGLISTRTTTPVKGPQVRTEYRYDGSGRLSEELSYQGGHKTARALGYAEDGSLAREETRRDGELLLTIDYIENGRIEELYEDGRVFVKATYVGGRKIKDDFFSAGEIVRSRVY